MKILIVGLILFTTCIYCSEHKSSRKWMIPCLVAGFILLSLSRIEGGPDDCGTFDSFINFFKCLFGGKDAKGYGNCSCDSKKKKKKDCTLTDKIDIAKITNAVSLVADKCKKQNKGDKVKDGGACDITCSNGFTAVPGTCDDGTWTDPRCKVKPPPVITSGTPSKDCATPAIDSLTGNWDVSICKHGTTCKAACKPNYTQTSFTCTNGVLDNKNIDPCVIQPCTDIPEAANDTTANIDKTVDQYKGLTFGGRSSIKCNDGFHESLAASCPNGKFKRGTCDTCPTPNTCPCTGGGTAGTLKGYNVKHGKNLLKSNLCNLGYTPAANVVGDQQCNNGTIADLTEALCEPIKCDVWLPNDVTVKQPSDLQAGFGTGTGPKHYTLNYKQSANAANLKCKYPLTIQELAPNISCAANGVSSPGYSDKNNVKPLCVHSDILMHGDDIYISHIITRYEGGRSISIPYFMTGGSTAYWDDDHWPVDTQDYYKAGKRMIGTGNYTAAVKNPSPLGKDVHPGPINNQKWLNKKVGSSNPKHTMTYLQGVMLSDFLNETRVCASTTYPGCGKLNASDGTKTHDYGYLKYKILKVSFGTTLGDPALPGVDTSNFQILRNDPFILAQMGRGEGDNDYYIVSGGEDKCESYPGDDMRVTPGNVYTVNKANCQKWPSATQMVEKTLLRYPVKGVKGIYNKDTSTDSLRSMIFTIPDERGASAGAGAKDPVRYSDPIIRFKNDKEDLYLAFIEDNTEGHHNIVFSGRRQGRINQFGILSVRTGAEGKVMACAKNDGNESLVVTEGKNGIASIPESGKGGAWSQYTAPAGGGGGCMTDLTSRRYPIALVSGKNRQKDPDQPVETLLKLTYANDTVKGGKGPYNHPYNAYLGTLGNQNQHVETTVKSTQPYVKKCKLTTKTAEAHECWLYDPEEDCKRICDTKTDCTAYSIQGSQCITTTDPTPFANMEKDAGRCTWTGIRPLLQGNPGTTPKGERIYWPTKFCHSGSEQHEYKRTVEGTLTHGKRGVKVWDKQSGTGTETGTMYGRPDQYRKGIVNIKDKTSAYLDPLS